MKILDNSLKIAQQLFSSAVKSGDSQEQNVYAFIYDKNRLISVGRNDMVKVNNKALKFGNRFGIEQFQKFPYVHAEVDAISKLWGKRHICGKEKLVIVRFTKRGQIGLAKPCESCKMLLNALSIDKIYWTGQNEWEYN